MASKAQNERMLEAAEFKNIHHQAIDIEVPFGFSLEEAIDFQMAIGPSGEIIREAGAEGMRQMPRIMAELSHSLSSYMTDRGVMIPMATWAITAEKA